MDRLIIANWQRQVGPNDIVWMNGDIFFHRDAHHCKRIMQQLPGILNLVYGNHDKIIRQNEFLQNEFNSIQEWAELLIDGKRVIMHHYPTYEWKDMHKGAYHLYGHIHSRYGEIEHPGISGRAMDIGIDSRPNNDMTLWSWAEVDRILSKREIRGHHEMKGVEL